MIMTTPHYRVGEEVFFNKFQAVIRSKECNLPVKFNLFDSAFESTSWRDPLETWDQLLDRRAIQIASKGRPIVLNFSGGTDSYSMYQVFKRNNIKLYAIHLRLKRLSTDNFQGTIDFLNKEKPDCRILIIEDDVDTLNSFYDSPDWIWKLSRLNFSASLSEAQDLEQHAEVHNMPDDYIQVVGLEKPRLRVVDQTFYSYQPDTLYAAIMGRHRFEYFFIHSDLPELHVKQSHMLANFILAKSSAEKRPLESYSAIHDPRAHDYYEYSFRGCGRFGDLAKSAGQKVRSYGSTLSIPEGKASNALFSGRTTTMFEHGLNGNEVFMKNYLQGLLYVRQDSALKDLFLDDQNYYSIRAINTKAYELIL